MNSGLINIDPKTDHISGSLNAPIILLEYGDYECPFCGAAHPVVKRLQKHFGAKLCFVFRNFPLVSVHPHAELAAEAAESAGLQNKFWAMHDHLFEHQDALEMTDLINYAKKIGLENIPKFVADLETGSMIPRVERDIESGLRNGVNGTPTFFINGVHYNGPYEYDVLENVLHTVLKT